MECTNEASLEIFSHSFQICVNTNEDPSWLDTRLFVESGLANTNLQAKLPKTFNNKMHEKIAKKNPYNRKRAKICSSEKNTKESRYLPKL